MVPKGIILRRRGQAFANGTSCNWGSASFASVMGQNATTRRVENHLRICKTVHSLIGKVREHSGMFSINSHFKTFDWLKKIRT